MTFALHRKLRPRLFAGGLAAVLLVLAATSAADAQDTAATDQFRTAAANRRDGLPISARTRFFNVRDNADTRNTAEHELLHGMGYAAFYTNFRSNIVIRANGERHFTANGAANGVLRMILTAQTTHVDPNKMVGGVNQGNTIMRPDQVVGQRAGAFEVTPMNDAFGWNAQNPDVRIAFDESFPSIIVPFVFDFHKDQVRAARTAIEGLFGNGTGARFDWTVMNVPPRPVRGERQLLRTDSPYRSLETGRAEYIGPGMACTLRDLRLQLSDAPGMPHPLGTTYAMPATLSAQLTATSANLGLNNDSGQAELSGTCTVLVLSDPGEIEADFATEMLQLNLVGTFFSPQGPMNVRLRRTLSQVSAGAFTAEELDAVPGLYEIDSYFDVYTQLSLENEPFVPSTDALYIEYADTQLTGACCVGGVCITMTPPNCPGIYHGDSSVCLPSPCPALGACCCGAACLLTDAAGCVGTHRVYSGSGTSCTPYSASIPCCRGDFNKVGGATVQDLFDYLTAYFSPNLCADANDSGTVSVQDLFDYFSAYFNGGC